jgi:nitroreductase
MRVGEQSASAVTPDPQRATQIQAATRAWTGQLIDLGGRNTLLFYRDLKLGTLDLAAGHEIALRTSLWEVEVETWDAIRSRRNVRSYRERAIAPQDLDRILEAARRTPSAGNQQAWDFVVCTDPEQLAQLARVGPAAGHVAGSAATIALVAPTSEDAQTHDLVQFDLGQATMSGMLAAADLGIGSAHAGVGDQELVRRLLGVPEDRFCAVLITLGVPADRPLTPIQRPDRRPFSDVVHRGHW